MLYVVWCLVLVILEVTAKPNISIFDKFHQNDFKLKFERLELVSYNKEAMHQFKVVTFKYNRTCAVSNLTFEFNIDVGNKMEVVIQAHKFMSNEYRYFPLRFQVNFCFALSKNLVGLEGFVKCGNFSGCPIQRGKLNHVCRWSPEESRFPPLLPDGKYKVDLQFVYGVTEIASLSACGEVYRPFIWMD